jgi:two-component system OmpR family sensor kinase
MRSELEQLDRRLFAGHVGVTTFLCLMTGVALWKTQHGGGEMDLWAAIAAGAAAGVAIMLRRLPGGSIARVLEIVDAFHARLCKETAERGAASDRRQAAERLESRLRRAIESAERYRRSLATVLGSAAHQLSQPLSTVRGWLEYAQQPGRSPDDYRMAIEQAHSQAERAAELARLLLHLGLLESVEADEKAPLDPLIGRVAEELRVLAEARHLKLDIEGESHAMVRGNALLLEQAVLNVIQNALKYSPEGGSVHVSILGNGRETYVAVRDDGPGIPSEELEHIFEPFYRGSSAAQNATGTGIGLALAKLIIESSGGKIQVESGAGHGSCFRICLPLVA